MFCKLKITEFDVSKFLKYFDPIFSYKNGYLGDLIKNNDIDNLKIVGQVLCCVDITNRGLLLNEFREFCESEYHNDEYFVERLGIRKWNKIRYEAFMRDWHPDQRLSRCIDSRDCKLSVLITFFAEEITVQSGYLGGESERYFECADIQGMPEIERMIYLFIYSCEKRFQSAITHPEKIKICLIYSDPISEMIAKAMRLWISQVIQISAPFACTSRSYREEDLEACILAIDCLHKGNLQFIDDLNSIKYYLNVFRKPLYSFFLDINEYSELSPTHNIITYEKEDFKKIITFLDKILIHSNKSIPDLNTLYDQMWPILEKELNKIIKYIFEHTTNCESFLNQYSSEYYDRNTQILNPIVRRALVLGSDPED